MMATKLTDSELAARVRAGNRQRAQRQQERRRAAGLVQLNIWVSQDTRTALDRTAAHRNTTVSETVSDLLERALAATMVLNAIPKPTTTAEPEPSSKSRAVLAGEQQAERDRQILELHRQGLKNPEIGRRVGLTEGSIRRALKRVEDRQP